MNFFQVDENNVLVLAAACKGVAPIVNLDDKKYKLVQHLEAATRGGFPSLVGCQKLTVKGEVHLSSRHIFKGEVTIVVRVHNHTQTWLSH
jgi:hypothetical protein